jgi:hypothetical protein
MYNTCQGMSLTLRRRARPPRGGKGSVPWGSAEAATGVHKHPAAEAPGAGVPRGGRGRRQRRQRRARCCRVQRLRSGRVHRRRRSMVDGASAGRWPPWARLQGAAASLHRKNLQLGHCTLQSSGQRCCCGGGGGGRRRPGASQGAPPRPSPPRTRRDGRPPRRRRAGATARPLRRWPAAARCAGSP